MWRAPRHARFAFVAVVFLTAGTARLAAIEVAASAVARIGASKTTIGVNIDRAQLENLPTAGRNFSELALLVPKAGLGEVTAGTLPAEWTFDGRSLRASGPAISEGSFLFEFPVGWKPPKKLGLQGYSSSKPVFKLQLPVRLEAPIKVDNDLGRWLDLPETIQFGSQIWISGQRSKMGTGLHWTISPSAVEQIEVLKGPSSAIYGNDAKAGTVCQITRRRFDAGPGGASVGAAPQDPVEAALTRDFSDHWGLTATYRPIKVRFQVEGSNVFGETLVRGDWTPTLTPPCHHPPAQPTFGGLTEIVAPHETFCVCGQVGELGQWGGLRLGGLSLGAPIAATSTSAVFLPPPGLAAGTHPLTYEPWGSGGGTGLSTSYIAVRGDVDDKKIRSGGSTPLTLEILGTERSFPVTLTNRSPSIIDLEGGLRQEVATSGGSPNQVRRTVTGLRPGDYTVEYEVALPNCPCDASNLQVAERAGDEYLGLVNGFNRQLANRWLLRPTLGMAPAVPAASELKFGAGYRDAEVSSLSRWPSSPGCVHLGGPVACPQGLPPGSFSEQFVPGGTTWRTPSGTSVFVPSRSFGFLAPEFAGVSPSNDFQSTRVEQPQLRPDEAFAPPSYKSEFLGGVEFEVARSVSLGVRYVHRNLSRVLDDLDCQDNWGLNLGGGGRHRVQLDWPGAAGPRSGACRSAAQPDSGLFYSLQPYQQEVLVKVLNGCAINDRYWVFASGLTDTRYALSVTDGKSGATRSYAPPADLPYQAIVDTEAFATCP